MEEVTNTVLSNTVSENTENIKVVEKWDDFDFDDSLLRSIYGHGFEKSESNSKNSDSSYYGKTRCNCSSAVGYG